MKHYHAALSAVYEDVNRFLNRVFTRIEVNGPALERPEAKRTPLMIVCTHRSQIDYFVLGHFLHRLGVENLRFAAGENLTSLPVIGRKFMGFGAFTVRRSATLGRDYVQALCEQVVAMLAGGDSVIVFPEGGRSYAGEMMEIRAGLVGAAVVAQRRDLSREIRYLPVSISYEHLPELGAFGALLRGRSLRRQGVLTKGAGSLLYYGADAAAFARFILAPRVGLRYGAVYIDYAAPVPVSSLVDWASDVVEGARSELSACRLAAQKVSLRVFELFNGLYRVLPQHVLARVVRESPGIAVPDAQRRVTEEVARLGGLGRNTRSVASLTGAQLVAEGLRCLEHLRAVRSRGGRIRVRDERVLRYCAATTD